MQGKAGCPGSPSFPVPAKLKGRPSLGREQRLRGALSTHTLGYPGAELYQCTKQIVL